MSEPLFDIAITAADLAARLPQEWEKFIEAFKRLDERSRTDFYAAGADAIMSAQGRAVLARDLRTKLETCLQIRRQAEERR